MAVKTEDKLKTFAVETLRAMADNIESGSLAVADFGAVHRNPPASPIVYPTQVSIDIGVYFLSEVGQEFIRKISRSV